MATTARSAHHDDADEGERGVQHPLLSHEVVEEVPERNERVQSTLSKLREQWMQLSGFRLDPHTGEWATQGGPTPEGTTSII